MTNQFPKRARAMKVARSVETDKAIARIVVSWGARFGLTLREQELLYEVTRNGGDREKLTKLHKASENTIRTQTRMICLRTGTASLVKASVAVLLEALDRCQS